MCARLFVGSSVALCGVGLAFWGEDKGEGEYEGEEGERARLWAAGSKDDFYYLGKGGGSLGEIGGERRLEKAN